MSAQRRLLTDRRGEDEIREVLERFCTGWEKSDADQVLGTIAQRADMMMYGTDLVERWLGYDSFVEPTRAMVRAFANLVYRWNQGEPRIWVRGDAGWACGDLVVTLDVGGKTQTSVMRSTFVLAREDNEWKIAHAHFSIGQEDPVAGYDPG